VTTDSDDTAVQASIEDVSGCSARADAQVRAVLGRVLAQRRSVGAALDYVRGLAPGVKANCWSLAEAAGHDSPHRMQALLRSYRWDWTRLRAELAALARAWLPCDEGDLTGPALTCASRSATHPSPPAAGSPARPASARSSSPSPRPPASNAWPGSMPPG